MKHTTGTPLERGFRLGVWRVRPRACELAPLFPGRSAEHVEPKAMQVLLALAGAAGEFVSKRRLLETVWPDRPVTEDCLTRAIHSLRRALGDNPRDPYYIETRHNTGYRLLVRVHPDRNGAVKWWATAVLAMVFVSTALGLALYHDPAVSDADENTIAVLPFLDLSGDPDRDYLSLALTDALILDLSGRPPLKVMSRTSVMPFTGSRLSARDIAQRLGVNLLVEGSVLAVRDRVRVSARLVDAVRGHDLWSQEYERDFDDALDLLRDISGSIALQLSGVLEDQPPLAVQLPGASLETWLRARYDLARGDTQAMRRALEGFETLAAAHPDFGPAWLGQAQVLLELYKHRQAGVDDLARALQAARRAEERMVASAELYRCLGQVKLFLDWDFDFAERQYRRALQLNPSDTVAHRRYAWLLVAQRRFAEAESHTRQVRLLDPLYYESPEMAMLLLYSKQTGAAVEELERLETATDLSPPVLRLMAVAYREAGREADARRVLLRLLEAGEPATAARQAQWASLTTQGLYRELLRQGAWQSPLVAAGYSSLTGDADAALDFLDQALARHDPALLYAGAVPEFGALHGDPRYVAFLTRLNIEPPAAPGSRPR